MLVVLASLVALACAGASLWRLYFALTPTALAPKKLAGALAGSTFEEAARAIERVPEARWEKALLAAMRLTGPERAAEINEQLHDLDALASRWARVPRVCASVSTSVGFMLASLAMREGLLAPEPEAIDGLVFRALNVLSVGIAGAMFCVAVHFRAGKLARSRLADVDALVEKLESLPRELPSPRPV